MTGALRSLVRTPARIAAVAGVTFTQLVRMRLFLVLAVFGIGFLALQFLPYQGQLGVEFRGVQQLQLIKDIALGCMQLFGLIFCVGATALLIPRDTEDRILYTSLAVCICKVLSCCVDVTFAESNYSEYIVYFVVLGNL